MRVPDHIGAWLRDRLIPLWSERALMPGRPGYTEYFSHRFAIDERGARSTLVTARLVYVFSHAYVLAGSSEALAAARHGYAFLTGACRHPSGRFLHRVALDGTTLDDFTDLYDLAFVLLAASWYFRATGEVEALALASETADFIEAEMSHPCGGFREDTRGSTPRRQNPHMHLLEACLALAEATSDRRWIERAAALAGLMRDRFFDRQTGSLVEFLSDDLRPDAKRGEEREPGHHFEWFWLLGEFRRIARTDDFVDVAKQLYLFGSTHGIDRQGALDGAVHETVASSGALISDSKLLWPQTEALKAHITRWELHGDHDARELIERQLSLIFTHFLDAESGFWHNKIASDGRPLPVEMPTRVLYHIVMALAEYARIEGKIVPASADR
ncbi:mannose-6-phosphate isomerase [Rhizobiales bacterium GAS113]|nr:mannose-6-phosphate isomerase [Rhizobiales bacterium GAS113]